MFIKQMQVGQMGVFAYLVGDLESREALVIDPADDIDRILAEVQRNDFIIKFIVNTHGHVDHTGGNGEIKQKTGAPILIHEDDAQMLVATPEAILRMFGAHRSPPADRMLLGGDLINLGVNTLQVIHVPGHSPGSIALLGNGVVFTGDTLFVEAVGRTDLPGGSWDIMSKSIREGLLSLPDDTKVMPGHDYGRMRSSTIGHERKHNPYL